jgi:hypothetical protein
MNESVGSGGRCEALVSDDWLQATLSEARPMTATQVNSLKGVIVRMIDISLLVAVQDQPFGAGWP